MITGVLGSFNSSRGTETFSNYHNTATSSRGTGGDLSSVSAHYSSIANATRGTKDFNTTSFNSTRAASNMINNANAYYNTYKHYYK